VLVATDIAARGIDIEALGHVVNFDVPQAPDDYIHRVGRTARAEAVGDAFTFVAPEEENDLRAIEKAIGKRLPRITLPDFDYSARPEGKFEVPIGERIAAIRARKADERARTKSKAERRGQHAPSAGQSGRSDRGPRRGGGRANSSGRSRFR
jgi:ATP-dependent RNA helicase RhlE